MPQVTYSGATKEGLLLYYDSQDEVLFLPYVHSSGPEAYTVYKAKDQYGNIEPAWSATSLGWDTLSDTIGEVVYQYITGDVTFGGANEMEIGEFTITFDPD